MGQEMSIIRSNSQKPIMITSSEISSWESAGTRVFICQGDVEIRHGNTQILSDKAACWFYEGKALQSEEAILDIYSEGKVSLLKEGDVERHNQLFLRLATNTGIAINSSEKGVKTFEDEQETDFYIRATDVKQRAKDVVSGPPSAGVPVFSIPSKGDVIEVSADEVDSWLEDNTRIVTAIGNVKIKRGDFTLMADNVILRFEQKEGEVFKLEEQDFNEIYAEGNVKLQRKEDVQIADKIFLDYKGNKGILLNAEISAGFGKDKEIEKEKSTALDEGEALTTKIKGEEIRQVGEGQYEIKNGSFTSCGFGHPHYVFKSANIRLAMTKDQRVVSLAGNTFYWHNIPLFYWPYLSFDLRTKPHILKDWDFGNTSRYGSFLTTDWDLFNLGFAEGINKWSDLILSLDYLEKRGPGVGINYNYEKDNLYGLLDLYYIRDRENEELRGAIVEDEDRWRLSWRHRQFLPYDLRLDLEANNLSDEGILREFYQQVFKEEKDEEAVLYLRRLEDTQGATLLINKQLNTFDTFVEAGKMDKVAERVPELAYRIIGEPLWYNRLNWTSETAFTLFDRVFNNNPDEQRPESSLRIDANNELSSPFHAYMVNIRPFIGARLIGYSDSVETDNDKDSLDDDGAAVGRVIGSMGVDMSTTFWRTYSFYNEFFDINRIRHIFTPELRYSFNPVVTQNANDINQFDSVDELDDSQWLLLGIRNRLQTKRGPSGNEEIQDLVYFDVELNLFLGDAGSDSVFNNEIVFNEKREDFVQFDLRAQITDKIALVSERNEFNIARGGLDVFNLGIEANYYKNWTSFVGQRFIEGSSSSLLFSTNVALSDRWEAGFLEQFDFRSQLPDEGEGQARDLGKNLKTRFVLTRFFHDWVGSLTAEFSPVRDETITRFDLYPKGLKKPERGNRLWF